ncbi:MAG: hypothetical protein HFH68_00245 [Lachnospiraceae bacterium]|nr:hypothetical protein [Lachnospiraceae bacterium]
MEAVTEALKIDYAALVISICIILSGVKSVTSLLEWLLIEKLGIETKWARKKKKEHLLLVKTVQHLEELQKTHTEDVHQSIRHDEIIKNDLANLTETVNNIAKTLEYMQEKENETKLKELKGSLIRYYNRYKNSGGWTELEKDAFWDLFGDYEKRGGDGYIHTIVEPVMRELKEIK